MADLAAFDVSTLFYDLEPAEIAQRLVRSLDSGVDGVFNALLRCADQLDRSRGKYDRPSWAWPFQFSYSS